MLTEMFSPRQLQYEKLCDDLEAELCQQIGQLQVDLDWKKVGEDVLVDPSIFQFWQLKRKTIFEKAPPIFSIDTVNILI